MHIDTDTIKRLLLTVFTYTKIYYEKKLLKNIFLSLIWPKTLTQNVSMNLEWFHLASSDVFLIFSPLEKRIWDHSKGPRRIAVLTGESGRFLNVRAISYSSGDLSHSISINKSLSILLIKRNLTYHSPCAYTS